MFLIFKYTVLAKNVIFCKIHTDAYGSGNHNPFMNNLTACFIESYSYFYKLYSFPSSLATFMSVRRKDGFLCCKSDNSDSELQRHPLPINKPIYHYKGV